MPYFFTALIVFSFATVSFSQNALDFDGVDDHVTSNYAGISGNSERTVEAWIKTVENSIGNQQVILDMGTMAIGARFTFCVLQNNSIRLEVGGNGIVGTTAVNDGNWHHVAATFDPAATNNLKLYIDGNLETQGNFTVAVNTGATGVVEIGRRNDQINHFTGSIDEVRVWDVARTQAEIQADMNDEICNLSPNLKLYYRFNEGVAGSLNLGVTSTADASGNGYNGTLGNFALSSNTSNWVPGVVLGVGLYTTLLNEDACETYTWVVNGQTYTSSGIYSEVLTATTGCDSVVTLNLSIFSPSNITTNAIACDSFVWNVTGQTYFASTSVTEPLTTSQGCLYDHTLNLTLNNSFDTVVLVYDECPPYVWGVNGVSYDTSGTYSANFTNGQGCDSTYQLNLVIYDDAVADITQNGDGSLSTSWTFDIQWVDCATNTAIVGETGSTFVPTANGDYAVIAYGPNWCPDTSACYTVDYLDVNNAGPFSLPNFIEPNPTNGKITISVLKTWKSATIELLTIDGKIVQSKRVLDGAAAEMMLDGTPGIYYVRATSDQGIVYSEPVVKF